MATDTKNSALKQSFFKDYFFYKLRSLKGFNITFLVMNLFLTIVSALTVLSVCIELKNDALDLDNNHYLFSLLSYYMIGILFLIFIAENVLIMIMAAVNMKFCHNRSAMDTVGGLPLTVSQRFFGDFLSGLFSFTPTFLIGCIPAFIMMAVIQFGISPEYQASKYAQGSSMLYLAPEFEDKFILIGFLAMLTMFLCFAASYTIACFVTSCSGKLNTSIILTFGLAAAIPMIAVFYGEFIIMCSIGIDVEEFVNVMNMLPPFGTIAYLYYSFRESLWGSYTFAASSPGVIAMLLIVILPAVGAYFISKKRKAEKVDKPLIYKPLYTAATCLLCITVCGLVLFAYYFPAFGIALLIFTLAACIFIEYAQSHSKKTLWKGIVRFAVSAAVCAVFGIIAYSTYGFNIGKKLPNESKITSVSFSGTYFTKQGHRYETYEEPAIISAVLSEHKKITGELKRFDRTGLMSPQTERAGNKIYIEYQMSDGSYIVREYYPTDSVSNDILNNFCDTMLEMPEVFNRTTLGMLNKPCGGISYRDLNDPKYTEHYIKPSAWNELIECLKTDLLNRPKNYQNNVSRQPRYIYYSVIEDSGKLSAELTIDIYDIDKNTLEFLSNADNFSAEISVDLNKNSYYDVYYYADGMTADSEPTLHIGFTSDMPAENELISYFETEYTISDEFSDKFMINTNSGDLKVKKENEHAALTALISLIKEQVSGGNKS